MTCLWGIGKAPQYFHRNTGHPCRQCESREDHLYLHWISRRTYSHGADGIWMQPPITVLTPHWIVLWVVGALYGNWSSRREIEIVLVSPHKLFVFWVTATHHAWRGLNVKVQVQAQAQNWWSFKLSIAKFCSTANIWGEICKNIKSKFWASKLF